MTGAGSTIYPDTAPALQILFVVLAGVVVVLSVRRAGAAAWAGWALVVGYLAADVVLLLVGRGAYLQLVARDPRYVTDALPVIAIGVCAAFAGGRVRRAAVLPVRPDPVAGPRTSAARRRTRAALPWLVLAAVLASGLVTTLRLAPETQHPQSERYVRGVTSALADAPGAAVLQTPVPSDVAISVNLESLLRAVGREQRLDRPGAEPLVVGPTGRLVEAGLADPDVEERGPVADCGWRLGPDPEWITLLPPPGPGPRLLRLGYLAGSEGVLHVAVGGLEQAVEYAAGVGERYVVVTEQSGPLQVWVTGASSAFCLGDVTRGAPVPAL